jgi:hypothetical protein
MTANLEKERAALRRLADALAEDILRSKDDEALASAAEIYGDPTRVAVDTRRLLEEAASVLGKERLREARAALESLSKKQGRVVHLDPVEARRRLSEVLASDPDTARKLTMAARNGRDLSDSDIVGMVEDLMALGILPYPD